MTFSVAKWLNENAGDFYMTDKKYIFPATNPGWTYYYSHNIDTETLAKTTFLFIIMLLDICFMFSLWILLTSNLFYADT